MWQNVLIQAINALDIVRLSLLMNNEVKTMLVCIDCVCQKKKLNFLTDAIQASLSVRLSVI